MNRKSLIVAFCMFTATPLLGQTSFENILSPARLPYLKQSKLIQISSADTTGGNSDFIAIPDGATATLASVQGPGVIVNIWVTIASPDEYFLRRILLRMYWDGERSKIENNYGERWQARHLPGNCQAIAWQPVRHYTTRPYRL